MTTMTYPSREDRKVRQVISHEGSLIALCEDGTMWGWIKKDRSWVQFPLIPVPDEFFTPPMIQPAPPK